VWTRPILAGNRHSPRAQVNMVRHMLAQGTANVAQIAKATGVKRQTVYRLKADPAAGEATLAAWGCEAVEHHGHRPRERPQGAARRCRPQLPMRPAA
jgi:DNA invertase Pin-like site-specific DNA recombinase